jgi:Arc/MetJ-type ribon-helix-helix transcriptional regulator
MYEISMALTVNLGAPYESIIDRIIKKGYAGTQAEVIRQALAYYDRYLEEEELRLVKKGVESMMADIESGKMKTYSLGEVKKRRAKKRS